jgi:hypothetical protein
MSEEEEQTANEVAQRKGGVLRESEKSRSTLGERVEGARRVDLL